MLIDKLGIKLINGHACSGQSENFRSDVGASEIALGLNGLSQQGTPTGAYRRRRRRRCVRADREPIKM